MRIAVTGGTGFIGGALVRALLERGDTVWIISRSGRDGGNKIGGLSSERGVDEERATQSDGGRNISEERGTQSDGGHDISEERGTQSDGKVRLHTVSWNALTENPSLLEGIDAIVNLAGESINQRWTKAAKERILHSRQWAAARVAELVGSLKRKPRVVVNASGISAYGISEGELFDEDSPVAVTDYLSEVVRHWEEAADAIPVERLVKLRIGLVVARKGGAFPLMALPYRLFGGGRVGSGKQGLSWIHLDDMVGLIMFCLDNENIRGPVNGSAPEPVSNDAFGRALGRAMRRPHWFPVPAFAMKALFGEMSTLLLDGQRAVPKKALEHGYVFRYPTLDSAMRELVGKLQ